MIREYVAQFDNGHDKTEIHYESTHRAGSKANQEDAEREFRMRMGASMARAYYFTWCGLQTR